MDKFDNIEYLKTGNAKQRSVFAVLKNHRIMEKLAPFSPVLAGTIPIEIDIDNSDLDIICHWLSKNAFIRALADFAHHAGFEIAESVNNGHDTVIARFRIDGFAVEIFGQNIPSKMQNAYRHMIIEYQIIEKMGEDFKRQIIALKQSGFKTEPAFAKILKISGDPYKELLRFDVENL